MAQIIQFPVQQSSVHIEMSYANHYTLHAPYELSGQGIVEITGYDGKPFTGTHAYSVTSKALQRICKKYPTINNAYTDDFRRMDDFLELQRLNNRADNIYRKTYDEAYNQERHSLENAGYGFSESREKAQEHAKIIASQARNDYSMKHSIEEKKVQYVERRLGT